MNPRVTLNKLFNFINNVIFISIYNHLITFLYILHYPWNRLSLYNQCTHCNICIINFMFLTIEIIIYYSLKNDDHLEIYNTCVYICILFGNIITKEMWNMISLYTQCNICIIFCMVLTIYRFIYYSLNNDDLIETYDNYIDMLFCNIINKQIYDLCLKYCKMNILYPSIMTNVQLIIILYALFERLAIKRMIISLYMLYSMQNFIHCVCNNRVQLTMKLTSSFDIYFNIFSNG